MAATSTDEPTLEQLQLRFPAEWDRVQQRVRRAGRAGRPAVLALIAEYAPDATGPADRLASAADRASRDVERRMLQELLRSMSDRAESGVEHGDIRLGRLSGMLLHLALFRRGLERKPVAMPVFRLAWRLARQRDRLMPLVRARGIYCFYSRPLLRHLARVSSGRRTIEIAAGDGTLTRFLRDTGADVTASDDASWSHRITLPQHVERLDARTALRRDRPEVVLCSWPPAGNRFERAVFETPSVRTYIVIVGRDEHEAGSPQIYRAQTAFDLHEDGRLSRLVLPAGRNRVLVFTRREAA